MKLSGFSSERWDTCAVCSATRQAAIASSVSVTVPIWLTLISDELATPVVQRVSESAA